VRIRETRVAKPPRKPPTPSVACHQVISIWKSTSVISSSGPPSTASQANLVVTSASGSGGGSGGS
jgi:hypothetical protein